MSDTDHNRAVRLITQSLRGPVANVFQQLVPNLDSMSGPQIYDTVIGNGELLHGCVLIFLRHQNAFTHLMVDRRGRRISDHRLPLRCGRSVDEIIAMLLRTHAKQHFRSVLGGNPNDRNTPAGRLYIAINDYLLHEWQIPLVPHYAGLPVHEAVALGPSLLNLRTPQQIDQAIPSRSPRRRPDPAQNLPATPQEREADFWWQTLHEPEVRAALSEIGDFEIRELTKALCRLGDGTRAEFLLPLGLSMPQAAVVLTCCYRRMGRPVFEAVFGRPGKAGAVRGFADQLRARQVSSAMDLPRLAATAEAALATMPERTWNRRTVG